MPKTKVKVKLIGQEGNAFFILGCVKKELTKHGYKDLAEEYFNEAIKGDYGHLLSVTMDYVEIE
jgi:hypothetical protein